MERSYLLTTVPLASGSWHFWVREEEGAGDGRWAIGDGVVLCRPGPGPGHRTVVPSWMSHTQSLPVIIMQQTDRQTEKDTEARQTHTQTRPSHQATAYRALFPGTGDHRRPGRDFPVAVSAPHCICWAAWAFGTALDWACECEGDGGDCAIYSAVSKGDRDGDGDGNGKARQGRQVTDEKAGSDISSIVGSSRCRQSGSQAVRQSRLCLCVCESHGQNGNGQEAMEQGHRAGSCGSPGR